MDKSIFRMQLCKRIVYPCDTSDEYFSFFFFQGCVDLQVPSIIASCGGVCDTFSSYVGPGSSNWGCFILWDPPQGSTCLFYFFLSSSSYKHDFGFCLTHSHSLQPCYFQRAIQIMLRKHKSRLLTF